MMTFPRENSRQCASPRERWPGRQRAGPDPRSAAARRPRDEEDEQTFLVFRDLPGVTRDQYTAAQQAATDAARRASTPGRQIRTAADSSSPATPGAVCIFDAESAADVTQVNNQAGVPFTDVLEAIDLQHGSRSPHGLAEPKEP